MCTSTPSLNASKTLGQSAEQGGGGGSHGNDGGGRDHSGGGNHHNLGLAFCWVKQGVANSLRGAVKQSRT